MARYQLERVKFLPADVDLLENETDSLTGILLVESDDRHLVALDILNDALEELRLKVEAVGLAGLPVTTPVEIPVRVVEHLVKWKQVVLELELRFTEVKLDVATKVGPDDTVRWHPDDCILNISGIRAAFWMSR